MFFHKRPTNNNQQFPFCWVPNIFVQKHQYCYNNPTNSSSKSLLNCFQCQKSKAQTKKVSKLRLFEIISQGCILYSYTNPGFIFILYNTSMNSNGVLVRIPFVRSKKHSPGSTCKTKPSPGVRSTNDTNRADSGQIDKHTSERRKIIAFRINKL